MSSSPWAAAGASSSTASRSRGKIALVEWQVARLWPYHVGLELGLRGAAAMIVYCPPGGPYYQAPGALGTFDGIWHAEGPPCVTATKEDGAKLAARAGEQVRVVLRAPLTRGAEGANVVGELPGRRRGAPAIVAGHHDGWFGAAFDDATGVAVTLELARAFTAAGIRPERTIAFVSHTAEEYGIAESAYDWCYGAWYQVVAEHREWATGSPFYLNVEGSGRPDLFTLDVPPELTGWVRRTCRQAERDGLLPHGFKLDAPNTWTEVWPFLAAGIPGINVSTFTTEFDRTEYHTQYDTADRVDFDYLAKLTEVCARLLLDAPPELDFAARARELRGVAAREAPARARRSRRGERPQALHRRRSRPPRPRRDRRSALPARADRGRRRAARAGAGRPRQRREAARARRASTGSAPTSRTRRSGASEPVATATPLAPAGAGRATPTPAPTSGASSRRSAASPAPGRPAPGSRRACAATSRARAASSSAGSTAWRKPPRAASSRSGVLARPTFR